MRKDKTQKSIIKRIVSRVSSRIPVYGSKNKFIIRLVVEFILSNDEAQNGNIEWKNKFTPTPI